MKIVSFFYQMYLMASLKPLGWDMDSDIKRHEVQSSDMFFIALAADQ